MGKMPEGEVCEGIATYCLAKGDLVIVSADCPKCSYCKAGKERWRRYIRAGAGK